MAHIDSPDNNAKPYERVWYTPYGQARHHWGQDFDGDRDFDTDDANALLAYLTLHGSTTPINDSDYEVELDYNRDGVVDFGDYPSGSARTAVPLGQIGELGATSGPDNWIGYAGYVWEGASSLYHVRFRSYSPSLGRWVQRDPAEHQYIDGMSLYLYGRSSPVVLQDSTGWAAEEADPGKTNGAAQDDRNDPGKGCGVTLHKNDVGNGFGHMWIIIDDPNKPSPERLGWWPIGNPAGGRGAWYAPDADPSDSNDVCRCVPNEDHRAAGYGDGDVMWDTQVNPTARLWFGSGGLLKAQDATCDDIRNCLHRWVSIDPYIYGMSDCRWAAQQALEDCGLQTGNRTRVDDHWTLKGIKLIGRGIAFWRKSTPGPILPPALP